MENSDLYLPSGSLPPLRYFPAGQSFRWLQHTEDSEERYLKYGGHPIYGESDILYNFNSLGYRSVEFDVEADTRILAIGCSYVMGVGLPQQHLFHELFAEKLRTQTQRGVEVLNLGAPGGSNDYISRMLHLAVPLLKPDMVLINFTHAGRREYVSVQDKLLTYVPGYRPSDLVTREIYSHLDALSSPLDNDLNLFRNYKSIAALLREIPWLFSSINAIDFERLRGHIESSKYVGALPGIDKSRDMCHPGPKSHQMLADNFWSSFVDNKLSFPR